MPTAKVRAGSARKLAVTKAGDLTGGFLAGLKRQKQIGGVWAVRGEVFARVMVAGSDARLSGAELRVLLKIALHLMHLGRSKGMMTLKSLADDTRVTQRTVRNALKTLGACGFVSANIRNDGNLHLLLDRRFKRGSVVPANADSGSPRRSAAVKKISRSAPLLPPSPRTITATPLPPSTPKRLNIPSRRRDESNGKGLRPGTAERTAYEWPIHAPPRKRAPPDPSG